ncbi:MAG TPA: oligosaccharide flippase family protein [Sphingobium sp.]|uniref:oligosaccharide flippase family protein n=1 Tax=Sphingobium sp. TaxID=1912891 RepID=UPI002ED59612
MSVRTSLAWTYATHFLVFAVTFGSAIIISRLLTPYELGVFGVGIAISGILGTISLFGIANYLIRDRELSAQTIAAGFTVNAILSLAIGAVLWLLGTVAEPLFSGPAIPRVLRVLALIPAIGIFEFVPATLLAREMEFGRTSLIQLGKATVNATVVVGFAYAGWSYLSPAIGAVAGAVFGALGYSIVGLKHLSVRLSLKGGRAIAAFAIQMISAGGVSILAARIAELIVAHLLGLSALGLYTRASSLAAMVWEGAYGLSTRVIYVQMAVELRERGSLKDTFLRATKLLTAIMWPVMSGIAVLSGPIIRILYGSQWEGAALPLAILMFAQFIAIGFAMNWELCVLTNRTAWQARTEAVRAMIGLLAFAIGATVGLSVAAAGRVIDASIGYLIYRPKMAEMSGATRGDVGQAYRGSLLLTAVAIGPVVGLMTLAGWSHSTSVGRLMAAVAVGIMLWMLTLYNTKHPLFDEMKLLAWRPQLGES